MVKMTEVLNVYIKKVDNLEEEEPPNNERRNPMRWRHGS